MLLEEEAIGPLKAYDAGQAAYEKYLKQETQ